MMQECDGIIKHGCISAQYGLIAEGGKTGLLAFFQCHVCKGVEIMPGQMLIERVERIFGLYQDFTGACSTSGSSAYLHQLLKEAFRGAEVGGVE